MLDIYPASEQPIPGITGEKLAETIRSVGSKSGAVNYVPSFDEAARSVADLAEPGDMVLTLGAGSVSQLGAMVLGAVEEEAGIAERSGELLAFGRDQARTEIPLTPYRSPPLSNLLLPDQLIKSLLDPRLEARRLGEVSSWIYLSQHTA